MRVRVNCAHSQRRGAHAVDHLVVHRTRANYALHPTVRILMQRTNICTYAPPHARSIRGITLRRTPHTLNGANRIILERNYNKLRARLNIACPLRTLTQTGSFILLIIKCVRSCATARTYLWFNVFVTHAHAHANASGSFGPGQSAASAVALYLDLFWGAWTAVVTSAVRGRRDKAGWWSH